MNFWPFGATVVFLAAVLISAGSSDLLGKMSKGHWMTRRPGRQRKSSGAKWERLILIQEKREESCLKFENGCCKLCPPGKFLKACICNTCGKGTYTAYNNNSTQCQLCDVCDSYAPQVVIDCAPEHNRKCGCGSGKYKNNYHNSETTDFFCSACTNCTSLRKQTEKNCSETEDAVCGDCLPSFHLQGTECQNVITSLFPTHSPDQGCCHTGTLKRENITENEKSPGLSNIVYLLLCLLCLLLLGASIVYCKRRYISGESSPVGIHTLLHSACAETLLAAASQNKSKHKSEEPVGIPLSTSPPRDQGGLLHAGASPQRSLLQGRKLYAVIDAVPVRRWKEFMRGLGLRDGEIEAVEVEHTQLREQQYEMLKRWRQQQGATADAIFAVLEEMQLGGCAQELREQLQPSTLLTTL